MAAHTHLEERFLGWWGPGSEASGEINGGPRLQKKKKRERRSEMGRLGAQRTDSIPLVFTLGRFHGNGRRRVGSVCVCVCLSVFLLVAKTT